MEVRTKLCDAKVVRIDERVSCRICGVNMHGAACKRMHVVCGNGKVGRIRFCGDGGILQDCRWEGVIPDTVA